MKVNPGSTENDEDFSWEDEDEDAIGATPSVAANPNPATSTDETVRISLSTFTTNLMIHQPKKSKSSGKLAVPSAKPVGSSSSSPRNSSDSFDVVSSNVSVADDGKAKENTKDADDDADSDWE